MEGGSRCMASKIFHRKIPDCNFLEGLGEGFEHFGNQYFKKVLCCVSLNRAVKFGRSNFVHLVHEQRQ